jgi:hypothetical protein
MQVNNALSRWQLVPLVFQQSQVAASQTNVQLYVNEVATPLVLTNTEYCMPFAGEVVGISWALTAAGTTGAFTIGPTIGGTECTDPTITVGTDTEGSDVCPRGTNVFAKGALIGAEITTAAGWDGTTADLLVTVWVLLKIVGI